MRTGLMTVALAALLLMPAGARAEEPSPDAVTGGDAQTGDAASAKADPAPAKDCHGPLYYRLKEQDRQNRQAEEDVGVMEGFVGRVAPPLFAAHKEEMAQRLAVQAAAHKACLADKSKPSLLCEAMAKRNPELCAHLPTPEEQQPCRQLLVVYRAVTKRDAAACGEMGDEAAEAICRFAAGGSFACDEVADGDLAAACRALEAHLGGAELPAGLPAEVLSALRWIAAIKRQESAACEELGDLAERHACLALLKADRTMCRPSRELIEDVDGDYTCRKPLVYKAEHPAAWGNLVALTVASSTPGVGQCEVFLDLLEDGSKRTMRAGEVTLKEHGTWQHLYLFTGKGRLVDVRVPCRWKAPSEEGAEDAGR